MNVLLAEDNPVNQEVALGLLETLDCKVTVVDDGEQAVAAVGKSRFDIVLMDCQMPAMDGLEATRAIRAAEEEGHLPIVALTANNLDEAKAACLQAGMDDVLCKPYRLKALSSLLDRWRPDPVSSEAPLPAATASTVEIEELDPGPIDMLRGLDPTGERGFLRRTIEKFDSYSDDLVRRLEAGVRNDDAAEVSRLAHSLKSSSANLGAQTLSRLAAELEKATRQAALPDDIGRQVAMLADAQRAAKKALFALLERDGHKGGYDERPSPIVCRGARSPQNCQR